jgi:MoaA/NifB/PqqE/SkfB family radical SAM enzyme
MSIDSDLMVRSLSAEELQKRNGLAQRKPHVAAKLARIAEMEERGEISPIIRLEKSYLCNFQCTHCSAEYYMDRHLHKVIKIVDERQKMDLDDVRRLSEEADQLGLARFVITGGEPLVMKDFDAVVEAIDPEKHYIITDTNGWFLDSARAQHLKAIGVEKVQLSLDSFIPEDHDNFRNKKGSYARVMRAVDASLDAGLNLILSTVLVRGRASTQEFEDMCRFATDRGIGLYISYAKPTGSCSEHPEFVITKEDADIVRQLEKTYKIFTHMTPSYGSFKGCITTKGIITVTSTMEVTPCPYIDMSIGNLRQTPLKEVLARGMRNPWMGPYRPDCIIGEDPQFIELHTKKTKGAKLLPLPWGQGFSDGDTLTADVPEPAYRGHFDEHGRCSPLGLKASVNVVSRRYFKIKQPDLDLASIHRRIVRNLPGDYPSLAEFRQRVEGIMESLAADDTTAFALRGVHVPFMLPQGLISDEGAALEDFYLNDVKQAYLERYPESVFKDHHVQPLTGLLTTREGSRHERLLAHMRQGPVVGLYLPALREFSVAAAIERVQQLPDCFMLAGGIDTAAALIANPDLLACKEGYSPLLWLAGVQSPKEGEGHCFEAYGYDLTFNRRMHFNKASETSTCGLVVLGR